uniref:Uncharacterized protein n=1 Tax=Siphoviridae sp. ct1yA16 TaxID=2827767 RepID=A0A8S5TEP4_9CAUD|nr:MAG TPA: hypothetical protein [Siphoviridae sp. ct1yA16]
MNRGSYHASSYFNVIYFFNAIIFLILMQF